MGIYFWGIPFDKIKFDLDALPPFNFYLAYIIYFYSKFITQQFTTVFNYSISVQRSSMPFRCEIMIP